MKVKSRGDDKSGWEMVVVARWGGLHGAHQVTEGPCCIGSRLWLVVVQK